MYLQHRSACHFRHHMRFPQEAGWAGRRPDRHTNPGHHMPNSSGRRTRCLPVPNWTGTSPPHHRCQAHRRPNSSCLRRPCRYLQTGPRTRRRGTRSPRTRPPCPRRKGCHLAPLRIRPEAPPRMRRPPGNPPEEALCHHNPLKERESRTERGHANQGARWLRGRTSRGRGGSSTTQRSVLTGDRPLCFRESFPATWPEAAYDERSRAIQPGGELSLNAEPTPERDESTSAAHVQTMRSPPAKGVSLQLGETVPARSKTCLGPCHSCVAGRMTHRHRSRQEARCAPPDAWPPPFVEA